MLLVQRIHLGITNLHLLPNNNNLSVINPFRNNDEQSSHRSNQD